MTLRFGEFVLDRGRRELRRGEDPIHLSPKAFHLLEMLVEAAPNAVTRDELYRGLWPETFVEEANIPNLIKEVRRALRDNSRDPRFIKTIHSYGYAFNEVPQPECVDTRAWAPFVLNWCGRDFPLRQGENVIGRDPTADIRIESAGVSRRHAAITINGDAAIVRDLGSKNGTQVDGRRIAGSSLVAEAVDIRLGSAVVRLRSLPSSGTTVTVSAGDAGES